MNLKARRIDPDITLWTPKERVKIILLDRFAAGHYAERSEVAVCRLETVAPKGETGTVTGRTPVAALVGLDSTLSGGRSGRAERETTSAMPTSC